MEHEWGSGMAAARRAGLAWRRWQAGLAFGQHRHGGPGASSIATEGDVEMSDDMEIIRGCGNVFRDLGHPDADREQLRALLAARIIGVLNDRKLTVRVAQEVTGVAAADFSSIRKANLGRFTIDRLMTILARLGQEVEVTVDVQPRRSAERVELRP
jgi:predicted XRE-type DNA-binding protein